MSLRFFLRGACFLLSATLLLIPLRGAGESRPQELNSLQSTYFSTIGEEAYSTYQLLGDGDLWPSCWADDDNVYTANGDGVAFTGAPPINANRADMVMSVLSGTPPHLTGKTIVGNFNHTNVLGTNWAEGNYNRKPTGMLCRGGILYLAYQSLNKTTFSDAPAASIAFSKDHGATWIEASTTGPMFGTPSEPRNPLAYKFTTIFFADFGRDSQNAIDKYVYVYGLDNNWRNQQAMYLARVSSGSVQRRSEWQFYTGRDAGGAPTWSGDITKKAPVFADDSRRYTAMTGKDCEVTQHVISQGGVVYDRPLRRYIFSSWSCNTHEFYEAPQPWGPWSHISAGVNAGADHADQPATSDFGPFRLTHNRGQYGTNIPSKFISADGLNMYLQSNVCCGGDSYTYSLRKLSFSIYSASLPANTPSDFNLALASGTQAISKSTRFGTLCARNCSDQLSNSAPDASEDDNDEEVKTIDWWGYLWSKTYHLNQVVYRTGEISSDGGWYAGNLHVQVRRNFRWLDVPSGATITPTYPYSSSAGAQTTYTFNFPDTWGDGVRITGSPGGIHTFTSISSLGVYYRGNNPTRNSGPAD